MKKKYVNAQLKSSFNLLNLQQMMMMIYCSLCLCCKTFNQNHFKLINREKKSKKERERERDESLVKSIYI